MRSFTYISFFVLGCCLGFYFGYWQGVDDATAIIKEVEDKFRKDIKEVKEVLNKAKKLADYYGL